MMKQVKRASEKWEALEVSGLEREMNWIKRQQLLLFAKQL